VFLEAKLPLTSFEFLLSVKFEIEIKFPRLLDEIVGTSCELQLRSVYVASISFLSCPG